MTFPALIFGLVVSTLYGAAFHLWQGGGAGRLALYIVLSWIGFWIGHLAASFLGWRFLSVGPVNLGLATILALIFLAGGHWLSLVEVERN
jgi:hypothetical protein